MRFYYKISLLCLLLISGISLKIAAQNQLKGKVTDAVTKNDISGANAKLMIMSPSRKHSSVDLKPMMKHFGSGLTLEEKGKYQLLVTVNANGESKTKEFRYTVR